MSLQFLGQKSWHPANQVNQKRIWVAEQKARDRQEQEKEKAKEVRKAADALQVAQAAAAAGDARAACQVAREQVHFLYAAPPGLVEGTPRAVQATRRQEDEAVRAFRRQVASGRGEVQRKLERYVGRRAEETVTITDQVERFPMLKDAPVEGHYTATLRVNFNPVGRRLRNVRCVRCGDWGHQSGDRECRRRDENPNDATRQRWEDPVTAINKLKSELVLRKEALPLEMQEGAIGEEFEILHSEDDEVEEAFLAQLSTKQRKRLKKKLKKQSSNGDSDSDSSSTRRRSKKKKSSKHNRKRKHKHHFRNRSDGESARKKTKS